MKRIHDVLESGFVSWIPMVFYVFFSHKISDVWWTTFCSEFCKYLRFPHNIAVLSSSQPVFFKISWIWVPKKQSTICYICKELQAQVSPLNKTPIPPPMSRNLPPDPGKGGFPAWSELDPPFSAQKAHWTKQFPASEKRKLRKWWFPKLGPGRRCFFFIIFVYYVLFCFEGRI